MINIFPTATDARQLASNMYLIFEEVVAIQTAVMDAIAANLFEATVDGTTMTLTEVLDPDEEPSPEALLAVEYYNTWQRIIVDRVKTEQMNQVIAYFEANGYGITRVLNNTSGNTFKWHIEF